MGWIIYDSNKVICITVTALAIAIDWTSSKKLRLKPSFGKSSILQLRFSFISCWLSAWKWEASVGLVPRLWLLSLDINTLSPVFLPISLGELGLCSSFSFPTLSTVKGN